MWCALLGDLILNTPVGVIAARFHRGLASAIVRMVEQIASGTEATGAQQSGERHSGERHSGERPYVALSGGVFQNRVLFERVQNSLQARGFRVLSHSQVPCNDGGLALGQAAIAAARLLQCPPSG